MQLNQIFKMEYINPHLLARSKDEALEEMINTVIVGGLKLNSSSIIDILKQRESLGSTGIGDGVAIPHGKVSDIHDIVMAFGRSEDGIAFESLDGKPVYLFFMVLAPENSAGQHLKILARISRMIKDEYFRKKLLEASSKNDLYNIITEQENNCMV
jgi:PTS system nitrogen regulatory IIA component